MSAAPDQGLVLGLRWLGQRLVLIATFQQWCARSPGLERVYWVLVDGLAWSRLSRVV